MSSPFELKRFPSDQALAVAVAQDWLTLLGKSSGSFTVALSGGRITKTFFVEFRNLAKSARALLDQVHFFWADERCVPPSHPDSNFLLAEENLFRPLGISPKKIHRLKGELPPAAAVAEAISDFRGVVPLNNSNVPVLDLIFLGLGEDGHIASLMPNAAPEVLASRDPYVHVGNSPKPPPDRLTMTYPVLAAAKNVWNLVAGAGKEKAFQQSLQPDGQTPFASVLRSRSQTLIYTDLNEIAAGRSN